MNSLPKYHETFIPILTTLSDERVITAGDLRKLVRDKFYSDIPEEILELRTKNGDQLVLNRIGWGKAYLKQAKLIEQPERGMVRITEKGKLALEKGNLALKDVLSDADFLSYRKPRSKAQASDPEISEASPQDLVDTGVQKIEEQVKAELLEKLRTVDPYYFERIILDLFKKMGYGDFTETSKSADGGIDGIINQDELGIEKIYTQAKRYNDHKVRETDIRNFIGAMSGGTTKGIFVTTSDFDEKAIAKAKESKHSTIILVDGYELVDLLYKHNVGVQTTQTFDIKTVDEDYFEIN
jgi:restriction system protein